MRVSFILFWIFLVNSYREECVSLSAQSVEEMLACYEPHYEETLPSDIFMSRSACVLQVEPLELYRWPQLAAKAQSYFAKLGLDVILYVSSDELFMGEEVTEAYAEKLRSRAVEHLVFLDILAKDSLYVAIFPFAEQGNLLSVGEKAWQKRTESLKKLYEYLEQAKASQSLRHSSWLVNEAPEFISPVSLVTKKYTNKLSPQLSQVKLAVAVRCLPCSQDTSCAALLYENEKLQQWFANYYDTGYTLIPRGDNVPLGYEYVLYLLRGPWTAVNTVLGQEMKANDSSESPIVYAFYIKHLLTGVRYSLSTRGSTITEALTPLQSIKNK